MIVVSDELKIECLNRYYSLLKKEEYFEAHEVAEELWHILRKSEDFATNYFKGLINAAIALEHLKRAKPKSKRVAIKAYESYLKRCIGDSLLMDSTLYNIDEIKSYINSRWVAFGMELVDFG